jgi:hypothetical protein
MTPPGKPIREYGASRPGRSVMGRSSRASSDTIYWPGESGIKHARRTLVVDRRGRVAADFKVNPLSVPQSGDHVEALAVGILRRNETDDETPI